MSIQLPEASATRAVASIRRYFDETLDEKIGDLKARMVLDFILAEIGPSVYNLALSDATAFIHDRATDLEGAFGKEEFGHWPRSTARRPS